MESEACRAGESSIRELSVVKLTRSIEIAPVGYLPKDTSGAVVSVYGDGEAYEVEFVSPHPISLTLIGADIEVVPEATSERVIPASD